MLNKYFGQGNPSSPREQEMHHAQQMTTEKQLAIGHLNDSSELNIHVQFYEGH